MLHTVTDFEFQFARRDGRKVNTGLIYEIIGESIPPRGLEVLFSAWVKVLAGKTDDVFKSDWATADLPLFQNSALPFARSA